MCSGLLGGSIWGIPALIHLFLYTFEHKTLFHTVISVISASFYIFLMCSLFPHTNVCGWWISARFCCPHTGSSSLLEATCDVTGLACLTNTFCKLIVFFFRLWQLKNSIFMSLFCPIRGYSWSLGSVVAVIFFNFCDVLFYVLFLFQLSLNFPRGVVQ